MQRPNAGNIRVITGPMFCGKTSSYIAIIEKYKEAGKKLKIFRPASDNRNDDVDNVKIITNSGRIIDETDTEKISTHEPEVILKQAIEHQLDAIFIDEEQWFDESIVLVIQKLRMTGIEVIVTGLDMDVYKQPFGVMPKTLSIADHVTKLVAICDFCKEEKANFSYFKGTKEEFEQAKKDGAVVGGKKNFGSICTDCDCKQHKTFD